MKLQAGELSVEVEAPEGVEPASVMISIRPKTAEEFHRAAEAVGGLAVLNMPERERECGSQGYASLIRDGLMVLIYEPEREPEQDASRPHPFFAPLRERVEREASVEA